MKQYKYLMRVTHIALLTLLFTACNTSTKTTTTQEVQHATEENSTSSNTTVATPQTNETNNTYVGNEIQSDEERSHNDVPNTEASNTTSDEPDQEEHRILAPTMALSEALESALAQSVVPYGRITLEVKATSTVKLTALNQTLAEEQNRTIELKGVDNKGTFYLYNVPLVKGTNTIRLQATNEADEMVEQNITIDADANLTLPLAMRATKYKGVEHLDTTIEVGTDLNVIEYLFDVEGDGEVDTIQADANVTLHLTDEGRYRPRVTVRTVEGLLFSSDAFALSLDVLSDTNQKDPKGAEPIDIAKAFVKALIEDDRESVEKFFLYSDSRWIRMLYKDDAKRALMREKLRNINEADWSQVYNSSGAATVTTTVHDSGTNQDIPIGFELTPASFDGISRGRMWFIRVFY